MNNGYYNGLWSGEQEARTKEDGLSLNHYPIAGSEIGGKANEKTSEKIARFSPDPAHLIFAVPTI